MRSEQQANEHRLVELSDLIVAKDTETAARAQAVIDVKHLAERQGKLKVQIRQLDLDDYLFAMNNPR